MVSNASVDLPDPDRPVMTTSASRGSTTVTSLRLCSRAPETTIWPGGEGVISPTPSLGMRTDVRPGVSDEFVRRAGADAGVDLVRQGRAVLELEVLAQIAVGLVARGAVQGHVERDQARALGVVAGGRRLGRGLCRPARLLGLGLGL